MSKIIGNQIELPGQRGAFIGRRENDDSGDWYIQFKNGSAVTRLKLTPDGMAAFKKLLANASAGEAVEFEVGDAASTLATWQLVKEMSA